MSVFLICISALGLLSIAYATSVKLVNAAEQIIIVNHQGFIDSTDRYKVYGEVKNTGDTAAQNIAVKITFHDLSNAVLDEVEWNVRVDVLLPGRRAPFVAQAGGDGTLVKSYTVELTDGVKSADSLPLGLQIVSSSAEVKTGYESVMLNGEVKNTGSNAANYVKVVATLYDGPSGTGNVVGAASVAAEPSDLNSGQTGTFQMGIPVGSGKSYLSYVLTANSNEYAANAEYVAAIGQVSSTSLSSSAGLSPSPSIPEFSSTFVIALMIVATLIAVFAAKKRQS
jgi:hypothetical protein